MWYEEEDWGDDGNGEGEEKEEQESGEEEEESGEEAEANVDVAPPPPPPAAAVEVVDAAVGCECSEATAEQGQIEAGKKSIVAADRGQGRDGGFYIL